jgi:NAD(P)-dependent dehydrogenase (short-subunit alcohol dehydrogenase family)
MPSEHPPPKGGKAVLVTGCSSGIGRQTAVTLAKRGFVVFATVRKESDAEGLRTLGIPGLVPISSLDLSDLSQISSAAERIVDELARRRMIGLFALVNNAGGGAPAPVELMDLRKFEIELRARVLGSVALVQAFLPSIRRAGGRILWIMTPAIIPTPYVAGIHACDFAVNCVARTLDIELKAWKIPNIMIRCGGIKTPAGLRTTADVDAILRDDPPGRIPLYEKALREWAESMAKFDEKRTEPNAVAEAVAKALAAGRPRRRYSVGYMARAAAFLESLPQAAADWILKRRF